jgi:hypothetical protein
MTTAEDRLNALFAADEPPARDRVFEAAVMAGLARRRFIQDMVLLGLACAAGALALGMVWDRIKPAFDLLSQGLAPAAAGLAVVMAAALVLRLRVLPGWEADT